MIWNKSKQPADPQQDAAACLLYTSSSHTCTACTHDGNVCINGGVLGLVLLSLDPVSYTHLDVYKRQPSSRVTTSPTPPPFREEILDATAELPSV